MSSSLQFERSTSIIPTLTARLLLFKLIVGNPQHRRIKRPLRQLDAIGGDVFGSVFLRRDLQVTPTHRSSKRQVRTYVYISACVYTCTHQRVTLLGHWSQVYLPIAGNSMSWVQLSIIFRVPFHFDHGRPKTVLAWTLKLKGREMARDYVAY